MTYLRIENDEDPEADAITEPISLSEIMQFIGTQQSLDENLLVTALMKTAREVIEKETGVILTDREMLGVADQWPGGDLIINISELSSGASVAPYLEFPVRPVTSITAVNLISSAGDDTEFDEANYWLDKSGIVPVLGLTPGATLSGYILQARGGIRVTFQAGHGAGKCPETLKTALKMLVKHWYQNREPTSKGKSVNDVPLSVRAMLKPYKVIRL